MTPIIALNFPAETRSGYATAAYGLCHALATVGDIRLMPHCDRRPLDPRRFPNDRREYLEALMRKSGPPADLLIVANTPMSAAAMGGPRTVAWTTQECDRITSQSAAKMNDPLVFRRVWAHSQFAADAFVRSGVRPERIDVVRPCLFFPALYRAQGNPGPRGLFRFGHCGTWHERKGYRDLLRAYSQTFAGDDDVVLEIKTSPMNPAYPLEQLRSSVFQTIENVRAGLKAPTGGWPRVQVELGTDWSDAKMMDWIASLDCYANASYGEGTGIPQTWAMGMGIPIVTTVFGAVGETLHLTGGTSRDRAYVVPHRMVSASSEMHHLNAIYDAHARWGEYDVDAFGDAMRQAFTNGPRSLEHDPDDALRVRALYGEEFVRDALRQAIAKT